MITRALQEFASDGRPLSQPPGRTGGQGKEVQKAIEQGSEGVDIGALIDRSVPGQFRGRVARRSVDHLLRGGLLPEGTGESEVADLRPQLAIQESWRRGTEWPMVRNGFRTDHPPHQPRLLPKFSEKTAWSGGGVCA